MLHPSRLRWNIKTILFRQFFWGRGWRASMGCFTEISFTTLLHPTLSQSSVYPQPVLRAMSILRKVFEDLQIDVCEYRKWLFIARPFNWLTISIWTKENLCPSIGMMMPCQLELKPEWDVQSMSDQTDRIRSGDQPTEFLPRSTQDLMSWLILIREITNKSQLSSWHVNIGLSETTLFSK